MRTSDPSTTAAAPPLATLEAVLERITYANEETGYTVARVATRGGDADLLTVVGALLGAQPGESLRLQGCAGYRRHPRLFFGWMTTVVGTRGAMRH